MTDHPRIKRTNRGRWHSYTIDGSKALGVTSVTGTLPKNGLPGWAAKMTANRAMDEWEALTNMASSDRLDRLLGAHGDALRAAGQRGTDIHALADKIVAGEAVEAPDDILGPATALARFYDAWDIEPLATEVVVGHPGIRVAGTCDLVAKVGRLGGEVRVIDTKTGSGPWESDALQVNAYAHMLLWQPHGPVSETDMVASDGPALIAKVLTDTVEVYPVADPDGLWRQFRYVLETRRWLDRLRDGGPFEAPLSASPLTTP